MLHIMLAPSLQPTISIRSSWNWIKDFGAKLGGCPLFNMRVVKGIIPLSNKNSSNIRQGDITAACVF